LAASLAASLAADVLIVGAGPAGAVAGRTLAARHSVILADRCAPPPFRLGESLIGAARPLLRDVGLLEEFEAAGHRPSLGQASSWGSGELVRRDSFLDPRGPGWRIDRVRFETMLREGAVERGATVIAPCEVLRLGRHEGREGGWTALIRSADATRPLRARFLIDATGRVAAPVRVGVRSQMFALDRLVCRFLRLPPRRASSDLDSVSLVEAAAHGWWYLATLPGGDRVVAFHTDADLPAARLSRDPAGFLSLVAETRHVAAATAAARFDGPVGRVSARSQWLPAPCGDDWCAVGDAAIAFDPLSSQGIFNALYTGLRGAEAVAAKLAGDARPLAAYAHRLEKIGHAYRQNLARYYRLETRFPGHVFWRRRHFPISPALPQTERSA
jgi:flavin-dependent dehydrogenase